MNQSAPIEQPQAEFSRLTLIRDVLVFQFKLVIDGFRDVVLLPAALIGGLISLIKTKDGVPGSEFYELMAIGKRSERWINLFGGLKNAPPHVDHSTQIADVDIDDIVARVETFVVDEYQRGGVTKNAKDRIDAALGGLGKRYRGNTEDDR
ncbi:MAG: hypothetical protein AAF351_01525 [Pseudomonadota bacterium]